MIQDELEVRAVILSREEAARQFNLQRFRPMPATPFVLSLSGIMTPAHASATT